VNQLGKPQHQKKTSSSTSSTNGKPQNHSLSHMTNHLQPLALITFFSSFVAERVQIRDDARRKGAEGGKSK